MHRCEQQGHLKNHLDFMMRQLMVAGVYRESPTRVLKEQTSYGGVHGC